MKAFLQPKISVWGWLTQRALWIAFGRLPVFWALTGGYWN
jgi:hypothetical protein